MDRTEGRRWSKIIAREADALEANRRSPAISREIVERTAVQIVLADELHEVEELLQQFAEAVKADPSLAPRPRRSQRGSVPDA